MDRVGVSAVVLWAIVLWVGGGLRRLVVGLRRLVVGVVLLRRRLRLVLVAGKGFEPSRKRVCL